jgi:hypothetical protein
MDRFLGACDQALRTLFAKPRGHAPLPGRSAESTHLGTTGRSQARSP